MMVSDSGGKIWPSRRKYGHSPRTLTIAVVKMPNSDDRSQDSPFVKRHMEDHGVSRKRLDRGGGEDRRGRRPRACVRGPSRPPPVCPVLPGAWNPASSGRPAGRSLRHPHGGRAHGTKSTGASASGRFGAVGPLGEPPSVPSAGRAPRRDSEATRGSPRHCEGLFHHSSMRGEAHSISLT